MTEVDKKETGAALESELLERWGVEKEWKRCEADLATLIHAREIAV